ncbi:MAG: Hpt domain-containing protein, partial [Myxococcales bacterium]
MDTESIRKSLLSKFREVTADRLEKIGLALLALEKDANDATPAEDVARELHTMKGEARMLGLPRIGELAHAAEDLLKAAREGQTSTSAATDLLLRCCDLINEPIYDLSTAERANPEVEALCDALARAAGRTDAEAAHAPSPAPP